MKIRVLIFILVFVIDLKVSFSQFSKGWSDKYESNKCPKLYPKNFVNYAPIGNLTAGNYSERTSLKGVRQCVMECCLTETCNVAFIVEDRCYHVECVSDELCLPLPRANSRKWDTHVAMILVKPVLPNENWSDILEQSGYVNTNFSPEDEALYTPYTSSRNDLLSEDDDSKFLSRFVNNLPNLDVEDNRNFDRDSNENDVIMDGSSFLEKVPCEVGAEDCPFNAECVPLGLKLRNGICKCVRGTEENGQGACVQTLRPYSKGPTSTMDVKKEDLLDTKEDAKPDTPTPVQNLTVSILSKQVQLPDNEVTLAAYTIPDERATHSHYNYVWTLVDQPKGGFTGNMNQNGATVTLTDLTEGQYRFKVTVNGTRYYGEGYANVTVLPPARTNTPPQVVITPQAQTVKLPNSGAVLDGSASKDDDAIISWHWELTSGPIGYQPPLQDGPTLQLNDLKQPGNYTFKLTVEDSDHVKNSTTANITVLNHTDYPPEANAGQDVIIYLPNNNLTLNGSLSTDDHEIVSWEWTKSTEDENKAVDMQNTHSPYLQLSNLSEGVYTFVLKVTDSSGQSSTADVHVFVKPPTNTPPVADAGPDVFISLPQTWVVLNGTGSRDDHRIVAYTWRCLAGPTNATVLNYNESVANATALTKGQYVFSLTVLDDNGNSATDNVTVTVSQKQPGSRVVPDRVEYRTTLILTEMSYEVTKVQIRVQCPYREGKLYVNPPVKRDKNSPPRADAGGDQVLTLPVAVLVLNGSRSSDDFRIVSWRWARAGSGLAAGTVILHSDTQPVLMVTNIEPGRYLFELTVTDDQGESSRDTVSVQVKPDPLEINLLEMTLNIPIWTFTQTQLDSLVQKMALLLKDNVKVNVTAVRGEVDSGNTQIIFFLSEGGKPMEGIAALALARSAAAAGGAPAKRLRSVKCLSKCSGRGTCDHATRSCRCDAFWMQSLLSQLDPQAMPNCDWSVVYASLGGVALFCVVGGSCWGCARAARRLSQPRKPRPRPKYRLLPNVDHEERPFASKELSDTETDSDVLFESKSKTTSFTTRAMNGEAAQGNGWKKNGLYKGTRKVKT